MLDMLVYLCFKVPRFDLFFTCRYDKDIGNHSFLNSSRSPFSSDYCDANSWLFDTNTVSVQLTAVFISSRAMLRLNSYFIFNIIF